MLLTIIPNSLLGEITHNAFKIEHLAKVVAMWLESQVRDLKQDFHTSIESHICLTQITTKKKV